MKKRSLKSLQLNKIAISNLKGGSESAEETYTCEESSQSRFCPPYTQGGYYLDCPSEEVPYTIGIGCVPPSGNGNC